jgi:hypothetical protein
MYNKKADKTGLQMSNVTIFVTLKCTLKCRLCVTYSPYYKTPFHPEKEYFFKCIDRYFEIVDHVGLISLNGGEPLIRSDLDEIVKYLYRYNDRFDRIEIITNGTIIPPENLLKAIRLFGNQFEILIDDYGTDISKNAGKAYEAFSSLEEARVRLRDYHSKDAHCGGWVDLGVSKNCIKKSDIEAKAVFDKCAYPKRDFCISMAHGKLWACMPTRRLDELGLVSSLDEEVFDLFDSNIPDEVLCERIKNLYNAKCLSACAYCNGMCDDSERFKAGEQIINEKLQSREGI